VDYVKKCLTCVTFYKITYIYIIIKYCLSYPRVLLFWILLCPVSCQCPVSASVRHSLTSVPKKMVWENNGSVSTKHNCVMSKPKRAVWPYIPSSNVSWVRNTAALFCITRCISRRIFEVGSELLEFLNLSSQAMVLSPASFSRGFCFLSYMSS